MIEKRQVNDIVIVFIDEGRQLHDAEPIRDFMKEIISEGHTNVVLDLGNVTYVSSSVLGVIVTSFREFQERGGALKLLNIQPSVSKLFSITRLDRILEIYNDETTAINSF